MLLGGCDDDKEPIRVVSIVGIGGMGKTTLAGLVYNNESVKRCEFKLKAWVSDSQKFDRKLLVQKILHSICPETSSFNLDLESSVLQLGSIIKGKKYFLVLDDVKNESRKKWMKLWEILELGAKGSRILVTTRSRRVAENMSSDAMTHGLECLSQQDSWSLFERMAFQGSSDKELVRIGRCIVEKCGGVPLAIMTIGCLLHRKKKPRWEQVRDNELARIQDDSNDIFPILRISYEDLDSKSKECFRYCALFPPNWPISREILIDIWSANVSFKLLNGQSTEDACEEAMKNLYNRCFLDEDINRGTPFYRMHDLMLDLARDVAGAEMCLVDDRGSSAPEETTRHLSLKSTIHPAEQISTFEPKGRRLRTLMHHDIFSCRNPWAQLLSVDKLMSDFPMLRMLDLRKSRLDRVPDSVGRLIHLRYLNLSDNEFSTLPASIGELWNLHSLLLNSCKNLNKIPSGIRKLVNLGLLNLEGCDALTHMPCGMGVLTSLHTLSVFVAGDAKVEELEPLSKLRGDLTIKLPEKSTLRKKSGLLLSQKRLRSLKVEWPDSRFHLPADDEQLGNDMYLLEKLEPHSDLKRFTVYRYEGLRFPCWADNMASVVPNLVHLVVDNSRRCEWLPSFGKLRCLKGLTICHLSSLEYMEENAPHQYAPFFPSLEYFWLMGLPKLKGWCKQSSVLPSFSRLSDLHIYGCPNLKMTSFPVSPIRVYSLKGKAEQVLCATVGEALPSKWSRFSFPECSVASSSSVPVSCFSGEFRTNEDKLFASTPWEQYLHSQGSNRMMSLKIQFFRSFDTELDGMIGAFTQMSGCLRSLEIESIERMTAIPRALQHLTALRELSIANCDGFTGEDNQSLQAPWEGFKSLERLTLYNLPKLTRLPMEILVATSLQVLQIYTCTSFKGLSKTGMRKRANLRYVSFDGSYAVFEAPFFLFTQRFQNLKCLSLEKMRGLEYIQDGNSSAAAAGACLFPSLECILLRGLPHLRDWCRGGIACASTSFPRLNHLGIIGCPNFDASSVLLSSVTVFVYGKSLTTRDLITSCSPSTSLGCELSTDEGLFKAALWAQYERGKPLSVVIEDYHVMEVTFKKLDLGRICSRLTSLRLVGCQSLKNVPQGLKHLTALEKLCFERCREFSWREAAEEEAGQWGGLKGLTHLELASLGESVGLPAWIQFIPSLREVLVRGCEAMVVPQWAHAKFDYKTLPGPDQQGFRLLAKDTLPVNECCGGGATVNADPDTDITPAAEVSDLHKQSLKNKGKRARTTTYVVLRFLALCVFFIAFFVLVYFLVD